MYKPILKNFTTALTIAFSTEHCHSFTLFIDNSSIDWIYSAISKSRINQRNSRREM